MFTSFAPYTNHSNAIISVTFGAVRLETDTPPPAIPIVSSASLQFRFLAAQEHGNIAPALSQFTTSFARGDMRSLTQVREIAAGTYAFGLYCLANQTDMSSGLGRCYTLTCDVTAGSRRIRIDKSASGVASSIDTFTLLAQTSSLTAWNTDPAPFALGLSWDVSGSTVTLRAQHVAAPSVSNPYVSLVTLLSVVDTSGALVSTGGAGVGAGMWADSRTFAHLHVHFDQSEWRQRYV